LDLALHCLPFQQRVPRRKPPAWSGVKSGGKGASNGVTNGAAATTRCLSPHSLHQQPPQGKSSRESGGTSSRQGLPWGPPCHPDHPDASLARIRNLQTNGLVTLRGEFRAESTPMACCALPIPIERASQKSLTVSVSQSSNLSPGDIGRHLARPRRPLSRALRECDAPLL